MINNTSDGKTLLHQLVPIETLLQMVAVSVYVCLAWQTQAHPHFLYFFAIVISVNILRLFSLFIIRRYRESIADSHSQTPDTLLFVMNFLCACSWSIGLIALSQHTPGFQLGAPLLVAITAAILVAGVVGSAMSAWLFLSTALPLLLPVTLWLFFQFQWVAATLWSFLSLAALVLFWAQVKVGGTFSLYRQLSRQNAQILKELSVAKEHAVKESQSAKAANETLEAEILERKAAEQLSKASQRETARILQDMQDTYFRVDGDGIIRQISPSIQFLIGKNEDRMIGKAFQKLFANRNAYQAFIQAMEEKCGVLQNYETKLKHLLGHEVWTSFNAHSSTQGPDITHGFEGTMRDVTDNKLAADALFQEKDRLYVTLDSIGDGVITTNVKGYVEFLNPVAEKMTGWREKDVRGKPLSRVLLLVDENSNRPVALPLQKWLKEGVRTELANPATLINTNKARRVVVELSGSPIRDSAGRVTGCVLVFRNVTKLRTLAKQLSYQASHDDLTGLINRVEFEARANQAIESARNENKTHAIFFIDLDRFKVINDTCGHHAGDELLRQVTALMQAQLRESDTLARLGGDEFGMLLVGCPLEAAQNVAEKVRDAVDRFRFNWEGQIFQIGTSIGLALIHPDTPGLTELLSAADSACYVAKENGRNLVHTYTPNDDAVAQQHGQMQWLQRIQRSLDRDLFELHFQAILPLQTRVSFNDDSAVKHRLSGELLLRMVDDRKQAPDNLIMPNAFIPAAERYQLMNKVDRWVIKHALLALRNQISDLDQWGMCHINLSAQSLSDPKFLEFLLIAINKTEIPPNLLCFEITETAVISNMDNAIMLLGKLKKLGCRFALDDFGSGLSSFAYLKNLAVDYLKIDGELIRDVARDPSNYAMVEAIHKVAHVMNMETIAEQVENDETIAALQKIGIDYAQGFALDLPINFTWTNRKASRAS